jgi:hypothetical protein
VPGGGFVGISGVESGKAAPLVGGPPGVELHVAVDELPSGEIGDMVPVVLPETDVETAPIVAVVDGIIVRGLAVMDGGIVPGDAGIDGIVPVVPPVADIDVTGTAGVEGASCPDGGEQVTTVPGVVGSRAKGTGASVVSGAPDWVTAENGLGPLSGEDTIVPGVDGRPMEVVPMVETCARQALAPSRSVAVVNSRRCIALRPPRRSSSSAVCEPRPCCRRPGRPSD